MNNTIIVLDFGSQYTQLVARRLREEGVYTEILPFNASHADSFTSCMIPVETGTSPKFRVLR